MHKFAIFSILIATLISVTLADTTDENVKILGNGSFDIDDEIVRNSQQTNVQQARSLPALPHFYKPLYYTYLPAEVKTGKLAAITGCIKWVAKKLLVLTASTIFVIGLWSLGSIFTKKFFLTEHIGHFRSLATDNLSSIGRLLTDSLKKYNSLQTDAKEHVDL